MISLSSKILLRVLITLSLRKKLRCKSEDEGNNNNEYDFKFNTLLWSKIEDIQEIDEKFKDDLISNLHNIVTTEDTFEIGEKVERKDFIGESFQIGHVTSLNPLKVNFEREIYTGKKVGHSWDIVRKLPSVLKEKYGLNNINDNITIIMKFLKQYKSQAVDIINKLKSIEITNIKEKEKEECDDSEW